MILGSRESWSKGEITARFVRPVVTNTDGIRFGGKLYIPHSTTPVQYGLSKTSDPI